MKASARFIHVFTFLLALLASFEILWPHYLINPEGKFSDWLVEHRENLKADPDIVLSISMIAVKPKWSKVGRWPWPRSVYR